jgi:hypothetical protein
MLTLIAGLVLGVLSRIEELHGTFSATISTHATWALAPFVAGALSASARSGAIRGASLLTAANAGYYAWSEIAHPGVSLESVAGSVPHWVAAGIGAGAVFGALGALARRGSALTRTAAASCALAVVVGDAAGAFDALLP